MRTEEVYAEPKTRLLAVVQVRETGLDTWRDAGEVGGVTEENFEVVGRRYLQAFRKDHLYLPEGWSRIVRRIVVSTDEPMEW